MFRNGAHFVKNRHKGRITVPAGYKVKMQMFTDACACSLALIQAHIDALTVKMLLQNHGTTLDQADDFMQFWQGNISQLHNMAVRADHEMAVAIGIFVHDDEGVLGSVQDKTLFILISVFRQTKDAAVWLGTENILNAPW